MKKDVFLVFRYSNGNFGYSAYADARCDNWLCDALITDSMAKELGYNSAFFLFCALIGDSDTAERIREGTLTENGILPSFRVLIETNEDGTFTLKDIVQQITARHDKG